MKTFINQADFEKMERFYRVSFFNTLSGIRSPFLIGTANGQGQTNLAIFNSLVHIGANPPALGIVFRPSTIPRHSLENLIETGVYTLNLVTTPMIDSAHQTSAKYDREISEFSAVGLNPIYYEDFHAPGVEESPLTLLMKFREKHHIAINDTVFVVGEILGVSTDKTFIDDNGSFLHQKMQTALVSGLDDYYQSKKMVTKAYARP
ncbi:MAG: flavin reductase [Cryomorphaceae bacterium]|nr:flavin reductase [Cryomorphaceae bacterium]